MQVISTRKVQTEDGTLFLDMKCGNLMGRITRIQTDQVGATNSKNVDALIYCYVGGTFHISHMHRELHFTAYSNWQFPCLIITTKYLQANEIARLIRQYITIDQRMRGENGDKAQGITEPATGEDGKEEHVVINERNIDEKVGI